MGHGIVRGIRVLWDMAEVPYAKSIVLGTTLWGNVLLMFMFSATGAFTPYFLSFICGFGFVFALARRDHHRPGQLTIIEAIAMASCLFGAFLGEMVVWQAAYRWLPENGIALAILFFPVGLAPQALFWFWWRLITAPVFDSRNYRKDTTL